MKFKIAKLPEFKRQRVTGNYIVFDSYNLHVPVGTLCRHVLNTFNDSAPIVCWLMQKKSY